MGLDFIERDLVLHFLGVRLGREGPQSQERQQEQCSTDQHDEQEDSAHGCSLYILGTLLGPQIGGCASVRQHDKQYH